MMLYHRLFRSASCMPTSRSYPRHLVKFSWKNPFTSLLWVFFPIMFFYYIFYFFSFESFLKSLPSHCPVITPSLPGHCPVITWVIPFPIHSVSLSYLMQIFSTNSFWLFALRFWVKERIQIKSAKELLIRVKYFLGYIKTHITFYL